MSDGNMNSGRKKINKDVSDSRMAVYGNSSMSNPPVSAEEGKPFPPITNGTCQEYALRTDRAADQRGCSLVSCQAPEC